MTHKTSNRVISGIFALTTVISMMSMSVMNVFAEEAFVDEMTMKEDTAFIAADLSPDDVIEYLDYDQMLSEGHIQRMYDKEDSLDTVIYANADGTETACIFDEAVKYINESGEIVDKSNTLYAVESRSGMLEDYAFSTRDNDIKSYFPQQLSEESGILVEYADYAIEISPREGVAGEVEREEEYVVYHDVFGDGTTLKYTPLFSGYKEDIILQEYVGNEFHFILDTNGLNPVIVDGMVQLLDSTGEIAAEINPIYVYDSCEAGYNLTLDNYFEITPLSDETFELTIVVDDAFLQSPETVYPVVIDPTVTINSTGSGSSKSIVDTPIYNGSGVANNPSGKNSTAILGYVNSKYGSGRLLMRFPGLTTQSFWNNNYIITRASLTVKEVSGLSSSADIDAYVYTGDDWNESSVYSSSIWNGAGSYLSSATFSYPGSTVKSFNITNVMQNWKSDSAALAKGIILKNRTNESTTSLRKIFQTSEGATKPYLSVTYSLASTGTIEDGIYYIQNVYSGKFLDIDTNDSSNGTSDGTSVIQCTYHGEKSQQFLVTCESDGFYSIRPRNISDQSKAIDLHTSVGANTDGTNAQIYTYSARYKEQKFIISTAANGGYKIGSSMSNGSKVLRVENSSTADNANVEIFTNSDSRTDDNWYFEKAFGCAWEFNSKGNGNASPPDDTFNCYLYALGVTTPPPKVNGRRDDGVDIYENDTVEMIAERVIQNVRNVRGRNIEIIDGPTAHINNEEYRFCLRVGHYKGNWDYHFWLQSENGEWCDKPDWRNAARVQGDVNPSEQNWEHMGVANFYDSETIYFAVTE